MAYYSHRMILRDEPITWKKGQEPRERRTGRFMLVYVGLLVMAYATLLILAIVIANALVGVRDWQGKDQSIAAMMLALPPTLIAYGSAMALVGGVFPAIAVNADASLIAALARGRKRFWRTIWRLAAGGLLFSVLAMGLLMAAAAMLPDPIGNSLGVTLGFRFLSYLSGLFAVHLVAVALSMGYLEAGGEVPVVKTPELTVPAESSSRR